MLPRGHKYRIGRVGSKHRLAHLYARIDWRASNRIIHLSMRRFDFYGRTNEPTMDMCLRELHESLKAADQDDDDEIQREINEKFREKLLVRFLYSA